MYLTRRQLKRAASVSLFFVVCNCTMILIVAMRQFQESLIDPAVVQYATNIRRSQLHVTVMREHVAASVLPTKSNSSVQADHTNRPNRTLHADGKPKKSNVLKIARKNPKVIVAKARVAKVATLQGKESGTATHAPLYSEEIVNPLPFNFTIRSSEACHRNALGKRVFLLILVKCSVRAYFDRTLIRKTWGSVTEVDGRRTLVMFVLGHASNIALNKKMNREDATYHDIIQANFIDSYRNLTYKTRMAWRWASEFCPEAEYVANADADTLINVHNVVRRLVNKPRKKYVEGNLRTGVKPIRGKKSKWFTPVNMYPEPTYAPFMTGGCYVLSADVAADVIRESSHVRFIPWEDVYLGLVLKRVGVTPTHAPKYAQFVNVRNDTLIKSSLLYGQAVLLEHQSRGINQRYIKVWEAVQKQTEIEWQKNSNSTKS